MGKQWARLLASLALIGEIALVVVICFGLIVAAARFAPAITVVAILVSACAAALAFFGYLAYVVWTQGLSIGDLEMLLFSGKLILTASVLIGGFALMKNILKRFEAYSLICPVKMK